jgi:hypothetical protein
MPARIVGCLDRCFRLQTLAAPTHKQREMALVVHITVAHVVDQHVGDRAAGVAALPQLGANPLATAARRPDAKR